MTHNDISTHPVFAALSAEVRQQIARNAAIGGEEAVRDRAHIVLASQGVDPFNCSQALWSAACETARSDIAVEAARQRRTCIVIPGVDGPTLWDCECSDCRRLQS